MNYFLIISAIWLTLSSLQAQDYDFRLMHKIEQAPDVFSVDNLQQPYVVSDGYRLQKYDAKGKSLYIFNENNLGKIAHLDVSNPLQLMAYYPEFNSLILLDRTLSELNRIDLTDFDVFQQTAIGLSRDNNLWFYDNNTATLKKVSQQGELLQESPDLTLMTNAPLNPSFLLEQQDRVYLHNPEVGIMVFDLFAGYIKTIELPEIEAFQLYEQQLFYLQDEQLYSFDLRLLSKHKIELPIATKGLKHFGIAQNRLFLGFSDKIWVYQIQEN